MEKASSFSETHQTVRSISLPSRIHPPSVKLEAAVNRLSPWKSSSSLVSVSAPSGSETLHIGLINLAELYNCVHELLQSPHIKHALLHHREGKLVKEALDGSVTLLDACDMTKNILIAKREHVQNLQSALRRRGKSDLGIESCDNAYVNFRKKSKRDIARCSGGLKKMEIEAGSFQNLTNADYDVSMVVNVLREVITITISIFRSLLFFLSTPAVKTKIRGLLSISKLIPFVPSPLSEKRQKLINEVQSLDLVLCSVQKHRSKYTFNNSRVVEVKMVQKALENLDESIHVLESGVDSVFKCLVQNRVSFLNILSSC